MMRKILLILVMVSGVYCELKKNYINFGSFDCPPEEKSLERCLRGVLNSYIPQLSKGVPEYGVPPCEPLLMPTITVRHYSRPYDITTQYSNITVNGPSSMKVKKVRVDTANRTVITKLVIPELRMRGRYKLQGLFVMLFLYGEGEFNARFGDIKATVNITLGREQRPNKLATLTCERLDVYFHVGNASMKMENLFGSGTEKGMAVSNYLNDNWACIAQELQAPMQEALRDFLKPLADHVFATLNADEILNP